MKPSILTILLLWLSAALCIGQPLEQKCHQVLKKNVIGKKVKFDESTEKDGQNITELEYLGALKTKEGRVFKILNYAFTWGINSHTSGSIIVYTNANQYFGCYQLGNATDLPSKLSSGNLLFDNLDNDSCDKNLITTINLTNGLPKEIFLKCKGEYGDIYSFTSEK